MASGDDAQCMYCERDRGSQVDHFEPRRAAPRRVLVWENLVWSCGICNVQKLDGGSSGLLDPTRDDPREHFRLTSSGTFEARTDRGRETERVFPWLARDEGLAQGRRDARAAIVRLLKAYAELRDGGRGADAEDLRRELVRHPFSDVLDGLLALSALPGAALLLSSEERAALAACPEVDRWLADADAARLAEAQAKAALDASKIRTRGAPALRRAKRRPRA